MVVKGEFEQRPEAKPASEVPLPVQKESPIWKILCVILGITTVALASFVIFDKMLK